MKQHITPDQLNELTPEAKEKLREWWEPEEGDSFAREFKDGEMQTETVYHSWIGSYEDNKPDQSCFPLLSIGQMIEFLADNSNGYYEHSYIDDNFNKQVSIGNVAVGWRNDLCDDLWQAVKEVLEKE